MTFEDYVDSWDSLCEKIEALKKELKKLQGFELDHRKSIADTVKEALGPKWKEGVNTLRLQDGRTLKVNNVITRKVDTIEAAKIHDDFILCNDRNGVDFYDLFKVEYKLSKLEFNRLDPESRAYGVAARAITATPAAPVVGLS